jgi:hypothetical protein
VCFVSTNTDIVSEAIHGCAGILSQEQLRLLDLLKKPIIRPSVNSYTLYFNLVNHKLENVFKLMQTVKILNRTNRINFSRNINSNGLGIDSLV